MSSFEVKVYTLTIEPHPNADAIELARVGDYYSVVKKGQFNTGDLAAYIPEQAVLPQEIIEELGLVGKLRGSKKDRVTAVKLRGILSQGLIYPCRPHWKLGDNVEKELGIVKYEIPPEHLPSQMRGKAIGENQNITVNYDIENIKKYNQTIQEGEIVHISEKIHGTFSQFGFIPQRLACPQANFGRFVVSSKGLGGRGIILDYMDNNNVYVQTARNRELSLLAKLVIIAQEYKWCVGDNPIYICGEIFGPGVQKGFSYGLKNGEIGFRMFDIAYGERSAMVYMPPSYMLRIAKDYEIPTAPTLYVGPFSKEILEKYTSGKEQVSGREIHMREGVVTKPMYSDRYDSKLGRVILKSVSAEYLTRKGETTEYN